MKLLNKYLSKSILYPTVSIITILSLIILVTQSLKYLDLVVSHGISSADFIYLSILLIPSLLFVIIPVCLFIAIMFSLNKLKLQRELNILKGFGINNFNIAKPVLQIALIITIFHYLISLYLMPEVNNKFKTLSLNLKENFVTFLLQENVFVHPTNSLTFYIKNKIDDHQFEDIFFQDDNDGNPITIVAKSGELINKDNKVYLSLENGNRQEVTKKGELNILNFEKLLWQFKSNAGYNDSRSLSIQEQHLPELLFNDLPSDSTLKKRMFAEANQRLIFPIYNMILTLLAIMAIIDGGYNRSGNTKRMALFSIIAGIVVIINTSLVNLSATNPYLIIFSYVFTIIVLAKLIYMLFYKGE